MKERLCEGGGERRDAKVVSGFSRDVVKDRSDLITRGQRLSAERSRLEFSERFRLKPLTTLFALFILTLPNAFASADAPLPSDDFSPFLLLLVLAAAVVAFVLVTIGTVLTFFVIACLVGLVLLGVFSTSALVAAVNRRVSSGIRALHYQLMALLGIVCGNALVFIASKVMSSPRSIAEICIPGSVGGLIAGLSFAAFLDALVRFFHRRFFPPPSTH